MAESAGGYPAGLSFRSPIRFLFFNMKIFADDTSLFFLLVSQTKAQKNLTETWEEFLGSHISVRCHLNPILLSKPRRFTFLIRSTLWLNHLFISINRGLIQTVNTDKGLITRLRRYLAGSYLLTIYKAFIRPHLEFGDVVHDYPGYWSFTQKLEFVQYNVSWWITFWDASFILIFALKV